MKKIGVLNKEISEVIAGMGHYDMLVIGDAGLPIPQGVKRIDLALTRGVPEFHQALQVVLEELQVQQAVIASEMENVSPELYQTVIKIMGNIPIRTIPHEEFKNMTQRSVAVIRTGEFTPYANIILESGVVF
ncbi:MAG: D-ribose pyranase [Firmicutes bacterium]|nr:D-ribose pyranase [Bacillota bacterium]